MKRQRGYRVVLELRLNGLKPRCRPLFGGIEIDTALSNQQLPLTAMPPGATRLALGERSVPVDWMVPISEPENHMRQQVLEAAGILLAKLPASHVARLGEGGIRFFKGERSLGGYYEMNSSTININVGVHPTVLPTSLLHEMGHLVHFEVAEPQAVNKYLSIGWFQLGSLRIRKFWRNPESSFLTRYSATSPEEDFAEHYAAYAAGLYSKEEWLRAAYGEPLPCPSCGVQAFVLDPMNSHAGICGACDTLFEQSGGRWEVGERNVVVSRAARRMKSRMKT